MKEWLVGIFIEIVETWGFICFYDTFLTCRWLGKKKLLRYPVLYFFVFTASIAVAYLFPPVPSDVIKVIVVAALHIWFCRIAYSDQWEINVFLGIMNYAMACMFDLMIAWVLGFEKTNNLYCLILADKLLWIAMLLWIRHQLSALKAFFREKKVKWLRYAWFPAITLMTDIYFAVTITLANEFKLFYSLIAAGLIILNVLTLFFLQKSLENDKALTDMELQIQKKQNQLRSFQDMQDLYEQQGRKVHDYKKQLSSIQELLESGEIKAAVRLVKGLTESISAEMSELQTGHPIVNAVLNQEYRIAKEKGIGMVFSVGNMQDMKMEDEDIIVLFGNLLENAIHECERLIEMGKTDIAILVKLDAHDEMFVFTIQNPVAEKIEIKENRVIKELPEGHGIGLLNVQEVVRRYEGNFVISCDDKAFTATVFI